MDDSDGFVADCDADQHDFESDAQYSNFDGSHVDPNVTTILIVL